jgi:ABC-type multidrug transport system ATPase subunit
MDQELAITARGLTKHFAKAVGVEGIDLDVPRGGIFGLLGRSGAGTTTVLRLLAGRLRPTSGTAIVAGVPVAFDSMELRRRIGVVDQHPGLHGWMTGRELIALAADLARLPRSDVRPRVDGLLERAGLAARADERIAGYTRSMRGRLAIAQALVGDPDVLLLDDPLAMLDTDAHRDVTALLRELGGRATVVVSSQDPAEAEALCDRGVILREGRVAPTWT